MEISWFLFEQLLLGYETFIQYILTSYHVPGTAVDTGDREAHDIDIRLAC